MRLDSGISLEDFASTLVLSVDLLEQLETNFSLPWTVAPSLMADVACLFRFHITTLQTLTQNSFDVAYFSGHITDRESSRQAMSGWTTDGVINYVMKLLRWAAKLAIEKGSEQIDHSILAEAYEKRLAQDFPKRPNPFNPQVNSGRASRLAKRSTRVIGATNKRVRPRKRELSISDVLSHR
jgi:hypothetical protein